jgi:DNA repair protein RadA/Sms
MAIGYRCEGCGIKRAAKWEGRCVNCGGFANCKRTTMDEGEESGPPPRGEVTELSDVAASNQERIPCEVFPGFDKMLGTDKLTGDSGIAAKAGHAIQICGPPGSLKSTLLMQALRGYTKRRCSVLYIAGEESLPQIKARADRLFGESARTRIRAIEENDLDAILYALDDDPPEIVVVDSINTIEVEDYAPGSPTAIRIAAKEIYKFTKPHGIGLFLVVQMNKLGDNFAGPRELEHTVDTSLVVSVERDGSRVVKSIKNRFGEAPASQRFQMNDNGLVEIEEPKRKTKIDKDEPEPPTPPHLIIVP